VPRWAHATPSGGRAGPTVSYRVPACAPRRTLMTREPRRPHPASSSRPGAVPMSQRHLPPASAPTPLSTVSRRTLLAATAATVPVGAAVLSAAPALADPSVTDRRAPLADGAL